MKTESTPKKFVVTLTEEQAEAAGFALKRSIREIEGSRNSVDQDLTARLMQAYEALDRAVEVAK